ncbi:uncharacterized protein J4E92_009066 [Alternaria infectoria]|uniref:uncharacterized protein n=1 Tax=Alternaria ventricosa TaxID=1187951 RepID=UPI0020C28E6D|nr:uncharacterized protein J4E93_002794 [Alternaria ventricosa]XP_049212705.1 uncharacterized protein J4E79_003432 [Alternaria viburni]XP_051349503.1 uncharacterized protein J4E92_009066 [Alternaria infectoria]KAI4650438.1 hypothetical protein J4E93_002794 [Alternaria ventricosa]KAI4663932.1 hypothetical protein J4E79_003432 [Alternaria viburni]KAI4917672.1 hypothetical protein J4E92_009066 [Alternaria infectoria]
MSKDSAADLQWAPCPVRPGWTDAEPENQIHALRAETTKLRNDHKALQAQHKILYEAVELFVKEATEKDLGEDPGTPFMPEEEEEEYDQLQELQRWAHQWKAVFAEFTAAPRGGQDSLTPTGAEFQAHQREDGSERDQSSAQDEGFDIRP